ncbi:MAG: hypothetical protein J1E35_06580 [Lachnospiraceae bacterium]|nr:hypothetical protein [Lachnospiraceae bacterium]
MTLYKNGFVVAEVNAEDYTYNAWPLSNLPDDKAAVSLTEEADERWFIKYCMQHIIPDPDYIKRYVSYCKSIHLDVEVLLFESPLLFPLYDSGTGEQIEICKALGFDCIGTVYYSYWRTEWNEYEAELSAKNIIPNKYRFLDKLEDALYFIELRKQDIAAGLNLENFWRELPVRISVVKLL